MFLSKVAMTFLLITPILGADGLVVHEWGTFTSVADENGGPQTWMALSAPADLPCFVTHLGGRNLKLETPSTVRMETPVLYFYAPRKMTLSVRVDFPSGWITEWYPEATRVRPAAIGPFPNGAFVPQVGRGQIEWNSVDVLPGEAADVPVGRGPSHYYAARNTDSAPIRVGNEQEKLIFYRGIGTFSAPLQAKITGDGKMELRNTGKESLPLVILFENRGGKLGYRVARGAGETVQVDMPELTGGVEHLTRELTGALVGMGLYPKEALAMIATWRDSWFEEGMRVFYLAPQSMVDAVLPLTVTPAPSETRRVFVGRVEVLSPYIRETLTTALALGDTSALEKFGRFVEPFRTRIQGVALSPAATHFFNTRYSDIQRQFDSPACVR